jgi:hypothetical protein
MHLPHEYFALGSMAVAVAVGKSTKLMQFKCPKEQGKRTKKKLANRVVGQSTWARFELTLPKEQDF